MEVNQTKGWFKLYHGILEADYNASRYIAGIILPLIQIITFV